MVNVLSRAPGEYVIGGGGANSCLIHLMAFGAALATAMTIAVNTIHRPRGRRPPNPTSIDGPLAMRAPAIGLWVRTLSSGRGLWPAATTIVNPAAPASDWAVVNGRPTTPGTMANESTRTGGTGR